MTTTATTSPMQNRNRQRLLRRTAPFTVAALVLLTAAAVATIPGPSEPQGAHALVRPVQAIKVTTDSHHGERSYTGIIRPRIETDMAFRVGGKIVTRHVDVGTIVTAGQVLAELDTTDLALAATAADAQADAAAASARQAAADEARYRDLRDKGHVSQAEYDRRKANADATAQQLRAARQQRDLARNRLDYATLRADADGVITAISAETGQVVAEGRPVLRLAQKGSIEAVVTIPEARLADVQAGGATVSLWTNPEQRMSATMRELSPEADNQSRGYSARFVVDTNGTAIPAFGMTATVHLPTAAADGVRLPRSAIVDLGQGSQVWVIDETTGGIKPVAVDVVGQSQDSIVVRGSLAEGTLLVAMGAHRLDGSETVRVSQVRP